MEEKNQPRRPRRSPEEPLQKNESLVYGKNPVTELLKSGRYTVTEVSSMVGFNSSSYFATCFKKYIGCLPTEDIKKVKG